MTISRPHVTWLCVWVLCVLPFAGCRKDLAKAPQANANMAALSPLASAKDPEVANVNGVSIVASELGRHVSQTKLPLKLALDDLIARELLSQEASRQGLADGIELKEARDRALVQTFLHRHFVAEPKNMQMALSDARKVYEKMIDYFRHGTLLKVHNVCTDDKIADKIITQLRAEPPKNAADFVRIAKLHVNKVDEIVTAADTAQLAEPWRRALFATVKKAGDIMGPTSLPNLGFPCTTHITYCEEVRAARDQSFEEALPEIRAHSETEWQRRTFMTWTEQLLEGHKIERRFDALAETAKAP